MQAKNTFQLILSISTIEELAHKKHGLVCSKCDCKVGCNQGPFTWWEAYFMGATMVGILAKLIEFKNCYSVWKRNQIQRFLHYLQSTMKYVHYWNNVGPKIHATGTGTHTDKCHVFPIVDAQCAQSSLTPVNDWFTIVSDDCECWLCIHNLEDVALGFYYLCRSCLHVLFHFCTYSFAVWLQWVWECV